MSGGTGDIVSAVISSAFNATATYYAVMTWNNLLSLQLTQTIYDVKLRSVARTFNAVDFVSNNKK